MNEEADKPAQSQPPHRLEGPSHEAKPAGEAAKDPQPAERSDSAN